MARATRRAALLTGALAALALGGSGCGGEPLAVVGDEVPEEAVEPLPPGAVAVEFDAFDAALWQVMDHLLGRGRVVASNTVPVPGAVELRLPAGAFNGAEFRSVRRLSPGVVEGRIRAAAAHGSLTALFLYEGRARNNDEVDIELLGGTRTAMFTVWQDDREVFHQSLTLDFDPAAGFHDYRISWSRERVEWRVDGKRVMVAEGLNLDKDLFLYVNAWWPTWLQGGPAASGAVAVVDRLAFFPAF